MRKVFDFFTIKKDSDRIINFVTILLAIIGLIMAVSASMTARDNSTRMLLMVAVKQAVYFTISYLSMVFASKLFNYTFLRYFVMFLSIGMIVLLLLPLMFDEVGGAQAWIRFPIAGMTFTIQPSEFAKVLMILLIAMYLGDISLLSKRDGKTMVQPVLVMLFIQVFIVLVLQSDLGSAVVLLLIGLLASLIPSHPRLRSRQNLLIVFIILGIAGSVFLLSDDGIELIKQTNILKGYQLARFTDYANPFLNISGSGYQLAGSLVAFARGGLFGVGLGKSIQKYGYLPEAKTDFILPLIAEEIGFIGVIIIFVLYAILIYRLIKYALKVSSEKDKIILSGTVIYLFIHLLLNVGGTSGMIPLTGVPLLLISSGGSSTMAIMIAIGISQNIIAKHKRGLEL